jgi:hypothetical protein
LATGIDGNVLWATGPVRAVDGVKHGILDGRGENFCGLWYIVQERYFT